MSAEQRAPAPETIRLLLVEDDHQDHSLLRDLLDVVPDVSFSIDWAKDMATGRDRLGQDHFDVCLIDQNLPDGIGLELLEYRATQGLPVPVIMMAEQSSRSLDRQAMALGASGFLDKNRLDPTLLERTIRYARQHSKTIENLYRTTFRDECTGLIAPMLLRDRLERALTLAKRRQTLVALVVVDVVHGIDDGLEEGLREKQIARQAQHLVRHLRESDTIARMTDRHLAFILEDLRLADDAGLVTQKVILGLASPVLIDGHPITAKPCAGIALYPKDCGDADRMLRRADAAMRQAKTKDIPNYRFASDDLERKRQKRILLSQDVRHALEQGAMKLRYRPLINTADQTISLSTEVHLKGSINDILSTDQFLPIADDPSLIEALTDWIIHETVKQLLIWQAQGFEAVELAVPFISKRPSHLPFLERAIRRHLVPAAIKPNLVEVDLDQDLFMSDLADGKRELAALKTVGVRLSLIDFGHDDKGLYDLANDHLDSLKLSPHLYRDLPGNKSRETLLRAVISLGHDLDLHIVADGTHDERQCAFLRHIGCDAIKLPTTCSPSTATKFMTWHRDNNHLKRSKKPKISIKAQLPLKSRQKLPRTMPAKPKKPLPSLDSR